MIWWWCALALARPDAPMSDAERAEVFAPVMAAAAKGDGAKMTDALLSIVQDDAQSGAHGQAWAMLATQMAGREWKLAAIAAFSKGFEQDPAYGIGQIGPMLELAREVGEDGTIGVTLAANPDLPVADELANPVRAAAVRHLLRSGDYGPALDQARQGASDQPGFADLEVLRGVVLSQQQRYSDAVVPLITAEAIARKEGRDEGFTERVNVNVARAYYAAGDFGRAIEFYAKIPRTSDIWLEVQFERAWSHFRGQDTNGALAMLHNHQAPFFSERFDPEADLLRAYSLFLMCKFGQASREMENFEQRWQPVIDQIDALPQMSPSEAFTAVRAFRAGEDQPIAVSSLRTLRAEPRMGEAIAGVVRASEEIESAEGDTGKLGAVAIELIEAQRDARIASEGTRVLTKVTKFRDDLYDMLTDIELTRVDLLTLEADMLQRAAAGGGLPTQADNTSRLRKLRKRRGFRPWPWQGEYWADEVGWYVFASRPDCPATMTRDEEAR